MFFRILKQSFFQGKKQKILAITTIVLSASLITALLNISIGVGDKMTSELKAYGANINIFPKSESLSLEIAGVDYNPLKGKVFLQEKDLFKVKDIFWRNNIVGFTPFLNKRAILSASNSQSILLSGTYFDKNVKVPDEEDYHTGSKSIYEYWKVDGLWPKDDSYEALIGVQLSKKLGIKIGDSLDVQDKDRSIKLQITGILHSGSNEDSRVITSLKASQELFNLEGKLNSIRVSALTVPEDDLSKKSRRNPDALDSLEYDSWYCTAYVSSIAYQIEENVPNASVKPIWQVANSEGEIIKKIQLLMSVVTLAALFASAMGISSLMGTSIMERSKEIGLIKALGATIHDVYLLFLTEAVIIGLIGGVIGFILGGLLSEIIALNIFGTFVELKLVVLPIILFISIMISLLGSIIPSRMIAKLLPVEVLYGH